MPPIMIIPAIDLLGGKAVRLQKGARDTAKVYSEEPERLASLFRFEGAALIHVVDLDAAFDGPQARQTGAIAKIVEAAAQVPVQLGGGLRDLETIDRVIEEGISRVLLGTVAVENRELVRAAVDKHGPARISVAVDEKDGLVKVRGWVEGAEGGVKATELAHQLARDGVKVFLHSAIARDGTMSGPDVEALRQVAAAVEPEGGFVVCAGGIGSLDHLRALRDAKIPNLAGIVAGRALYERAFTLRQAYGVLEQGS